MTRLWRGCEVKGVSGAKALYTTRMGARRALCARVAKRFGPGFNNAKVSAINARVLSVVYLNLLFLSCGRMPPRWMAFTVVAGKLTWDFALCARCAETPPVAGARHHRAFFLLLVVVSLVCLALCLWHSLQPPGSNRCHSGRRQEHASGAAAATASKGPPPPEAADRCRRCRRPHWRQHPSNKGMCKCGTPSIAGSTLRPRDTEGFLLQTHKKLVNGRLCWQFPSPPPGVPRKWTYELSAPTAICYLRLICCSLCLVWSGVPWPSVRIRHPAIRPFLCRSQILWCYIYKSQARA